uniref:Putative transcription factor H2A superfamily protein n=1 Tax=Linum usitatissimum TaxID=4006 RepID=F6LC75_LINUS|nr:putative transcription factor H2A superfamily protein [Linum usitatissimum]
MERGGGDIEGVESSANRHPRQHARQPPAAAAVTGGPPPVPSVHSSSSSSRIGKIPLPAMNPPPQQNPPPPGGRGRGRPLQLREQDQYMPIANVIRIMRRILPPHAKISDDAKETIQECVSEYISFVTGEANERCQREQRKTVTADDVLWAMGKLGFDNYVEPLSLYLARYRETEGDRASYRDPSLLVKRSAAAAHHHHRQDFGPSMMMPPTAAPNFQMPQGHNGNFPMPQQGPNGNFQMLQQGGQNNNINQGMYDAAAAGGYYREPMLFGSSSGQGSSSGGAGGGGEDGGAGMANFDHLYSQFK